MKTVKKRTLINKGNRNIRYWLLKTEPEDWSWNRQVKLGKKGAEWNGVRNFQAAKNLKNMRRGDKCFFYHTGKQKKIVGIVKVIKEHFKDKLDKTNKFVSIIVQAEDKLTKSVTLKEIKNNCLLYTSPSPRDGLLSRMPSSA